MNPSSTPNHTLFTSTNMVRLQVSHQYAEELVEWLINKSIPFELNFPQAKEISYPTRENIELRTPLPTKLPIANPFADIYQKYILDMLESTPPSAEEIAKEVGMSPISFKNRFKQIYGKPFYQLFLKKRMEYAAELVKQGYRCNEVSQRVGYGKKSAIKFNKMFQKHFGITPKGYQMEHYGSLNERGK